MNSGPFDIKSDREPDRESNRELGENGFILQLQNSNAYSHKTRNIHLTQTHSAWLLLTGSFAYKIKKPVDFGFLDFSSLDKRLRFCQLEVELNSRFSPELYIGVVPITRHKKQIIMDGRQGEIIDYAVKMKQFPSDSLLSDLQSRSQLNHHHIEQLEELISEFHQSAEIAADCSSYGAKKSILHWVEENFEHINAGEDRNLQQAKLTQINEWVERQAQVLSPAFKLRKASGFVRNCHGDLHLKNITLVGEIIKLFDCIEFNDELRWIDVMSEVAFLLMDLEEKGAAQLANQFLNGYLENTGDYAGLRVLTFYKVYRALVRAKVAVLTSQQLEKNSQDYKTKIQEYQQYLDYICYAIVEPEPQLMITFGFSGSGKTFLVKQLCNERGYIYIRSDVERKRLSGLRALDKSLSDLDSGLYTAKQTEQTYHRLIELAAEAIDSGFSVVLDATFLQKQYREMAYKLARDKKVKAIILHCFAPESVLRQRIISRQKGESDASEADLKVLAYQQQKSEMLTAQEHSKTILVDTTRADCLETLLKQIRSTKQL
ncbi:MAG: AAA family ATPase [Kangiellaceae bacterium]|nr:AAA family ATPase [Kangiellaceae bacterium]MCW8999330.1 AAA family ATPase [Kangiellaceae bacterium]